MLISSHDLKNISEVCDRISILEKGIIIHDLKTNENILKELENYFSVLDLEEGMNFRIQQIVDF